MATNFEPIHGLSEDEVSEYLISRCVCSVLVRYLYGELTMSKLASLLANVTMCRYAPKGMLAIFRS